MNYAFGTTTLSPNLFLSANPDPTFSKTFPHLKSSLQTTFQALLALKTCYRTHFTCSSHVLLSFSQFVPPLCLYFPCVGQATNELLSWMNCINRSALEFQAFHFPFVQDLGIFRDPITETENGFMEPKYLAFRR